MELQFDSVVALWRMGGHGPFVWSAYGITALVVLALLLMPRLREARELRRVRAQQRRRQGHDRNLTTEEGA